MDHSHIPPTHGDHPRRVRLTREQVDSTASSAQHALILRRLRHSQLQNALIKHKAQRFVALRTLHRSAELRRQLSQARAAAASSAAGGANSAIPPPLDPSVKALIEKLTELAEVIPYGYSGDQHGRSPAQRVFYQGGNLDVEDHQQQNAEAAGYQPRARVQNATDGKTLAAAATAAEQAAPRGPPAELNKDGGASNRGWEEREPTGSVSATNEPDDEDNDAFGGEEMEAAAGGPLGPRAPSNEDFMGTTEEDDILIQQLRELDSNMNTVFQDLEKKGKKSKDSELSKKTGAAENLSKEEDEGKKREEDSRQKERAALLAQLEGLSGGGHTRRPLWRWIAEGVDDPHPDRVLKGKHLWKAAALLVIVFFVRPKRTLMQRKARYCGLLTSPFPSCQFLERNQELKDGTAQHQKRDSVF